MFQIDRLRIGHDSKGDGKGIFVEEVEVAPAEQDRTIFPCYCWLAEGRGDNKMEREILPGQPRPPRPSKCNGDFRGAVPWLSCSFCQCCQIFFALELSVSAEIT